MNSVTSRDSLMMVPQTANVAVHIDQVTKTYSGRDVVRDISLEIREGEFVTILGPSGCGKTTTLKIVAGLEYPSRGRVWMGGADVTSVAANRRPSNLVFQRVTLFPHLNVGENVAFGLRVKRVPKRLIAERVGSALELVGLPGFEKRGVDTLSGGEAQRVALARALVNQPEVMLFDEPLSALDLQIRRQLQVQLRGIQRQIAGTFLYVTHDQEEAMLLADRVVLMNDGQIEQDGTPEEIYHFPRSEFAARFIGAANVLSARVIDAAASGLRLDAAGVMIVADPPKGGTLTPGDDAVVVLRPEAIALAVRSERGRFEANEAEVVIADVRFVGGSVRYEMRLGDQLLVASRPGGHAEGLTIGERVCVSWRTADVLVLQR